jgi:hypothetical protein
MIGKIERVPLRDIWKHEAYDFTTWLQDNIDILNDALGLSLSNPEREQSAGSFNVDLVAEDEAGNPVIIENQLEKSDHNHLGKLITYLTAIGAKTAIWIVADPRPEHVGAISWLNESLSANFYLLKVEGIRIGDSEPAPLLTLILGPSEESRAVGEKKKEMAERYSLRYEFWNELLEKAKEKTKLHAQISPGQYGWVGTGAGKRGLGYNYGVTKHEGQVELYIDRGRDSEDENKKIFDELISHKDEVEEVFGEPLKWERLEGKRACRISKKIEIGGYRDDAKWPEVHEAMIDAMCRLEKSLKPYISKLKI